MDEKTKATLYFKCFFSWVHLESQDGKISKHNAKEGKQMNHLQADNGDHVVETRYSAL